MKPAIVVVGYSRTASLQRLLNSIASASYDVEDIPLVISLDRAENHSEVEQLANAFEWKHGPKIVRTFEERQGLKKHIISCGDLTEQYGSVIILEDDVIVSPAFYEYTYKALDHYENTPQIAGAALYSHQWNGYCNLPFEAQDSDFDAFIAQFSISSGQSWTWECWSKFKRWFDENDGHLTYRDDKMPHQITTWPETSWGKYFAHFMVENDLYYVVPYRSMSTNSGEAGQHTDIQFTQIQVSMSAARSSFCFPDFDDAIKYDMFHERIGLEHCFDENLSSQGIAADLYGMRAIGSERYLLSSSIKDFHIVQSFGAQYRPHEVNIQKAVPGQVYFLYDTHQPEKNRVNKNTHELARLDYYRFGIGWRAAFKYGFLELLACLQRKLSK